MDTLKKTVLLVEDEPIVNRVFEKILNRAGYDVVTARSSEEALMFCRQSEGPIHFGIIDLSISTTSGPVLAKKITDIFPDIKVLFTTGYSDLELEKKKIVISSENCLYIPFKAETLLNKLTEVSYH